MISPGNHRYLFLFCKITQQNTITINLLIITLQHVSTLSCHLQTARIHYLAKLHKYFRCSCFVIQYIRFILWSLKSHYNKMFEILKFSNLKLNGVKS